MIGNNADSRFDDVEMHTFSCLAQMTEPKTQRILTRPPEPSLRTSTLVTDCFFLAQQTEPRKKKSKDDAQMVDEVCPASLFRSRKEQSSSQLNLQSDSFENGKHCSLQAAVKSSRLKGQGLPRSLLLSECAALYVFKCLVRKYM